jgi:HD-GYP domain-containing protein (c-di-GMP phosphodiesterase class II)
MELAMAIHHPNNADTVLLREGAALDRFSIPHLMQLGIQDVWITYPGLEHLIRYVDPELISNYRTLTTCLGLAIDQAMVRSPIDVDFYSCKKSLLSIIKQLSEHQQSAVWVTQVTTGDKPFVRHCGNVAAMSLIMGMKLDFYLVRERSRLPSGRAKDLTSLGIGALLHDLGMLRLNAEELARYNSTLDTNDPGWRRHTALGYEMVRGVLDPTAAIIALHHHQAWDGTGFPQRPSLRGGTRPAAERDIHVLARIVGAAEMFQRIAHPAHAPGSDERKLPSIPTVRALKKMLEPSIRAKIDPVIFRALFSITPAYSPGSVVTLSDGVQAVVVDWNTEQPCKPVVEVLQEFDPRPRKRRGKVERIDLREHPDLMIVGIDGEDVRDDNFAPTEPGEFDLLAMYRSMENRAHTDLAAKIAEQNAPKPVSTEDGETQAEAA